jgi:hypothetical protein
MTVAGKTAQPLQPAAPFARWAFAVVCLLVALRQPRNSMGWLLLGGSVPIAHLSLWTAEMTS